MEVPDVPFVNVAIDTGATPLTIMKRRVSARAPVGMAKITIAVSAIRNIEYLPLQVVTGEILTPSDGIANQIPVASLRGPSPLTCLFCNRPNSSSS
jgi:hypothetical protein